MRDAESLIGLGMCGLCRATFAFDPGTVPVMTLDLVTGLPPDVGGDPARAKPYPICDGCVGDVEQARARQGLAPAWPRHRPGRRG